MHFWTNDGCKLGIHHLEMTGKDEDLDVLDHSMTASHQWELVTIKTNTVHRCVR